MKKFITRGFLILLGCVSTTEYTTDKQNNTVYKTICPHTYSTSKCVEKTKEICPNQLKSAEGHYYSNDYFFAEVLFVCKDKIEVK